MNHCHEYEELSRRDFIGGGTAFAGLLVGQALVPEWMPSLALANPVTGPRGDTLVCIFLRGGADGLNMVVPFGDEAYYAARPTLAIGRPDQRSADSNALALDDFFGLHPALQPLESIYAAGDLGIVHATGAPDESRSHFVAQALMEQGAGDDYTGWLARHLASLDTGNASPLRAVGVGNLLAMALRGDVPATVMQSAENYRLQAPNAYANNIEAVLSEIYGDPQQVLNGAAAQTLATLDLVEKVRGVPTAAYGQTSLGKGLRTVAQLIKADVGVEVACVDFGGWDTHAGQGAGEGAMARQMAVLSTELSTFYDDLQAQMGNVTVAVMSEFGRRVSENASRGTDHGHGGMMMVLGGNVRGGQVYADWPGLDAANLERGDLAITTDYRSVLAEIVRKRLNNSAVEAVFPGFVVRELGIVG